MLRFLTRSVEEAVYLGTEIVVTSPGPDIAAAREQVPSMIWAMGDEHRRRTVTRESTEDAGDAR